ncbi:plasmid mobilization protein [Rufibacter quisquiliarum]|uniref:Bacterial mobilisation domain-containing protein n=1 Tax=Rufibacter quisquiliarum TaxID=1549639 RepID=A0A839GQ44_9BACT|nr:plasmid mobilization relaxosome protein MobC [Rufibacter quisquiliarum]MBA9076558.1 hypothetical protein [Rufibacter quisquiliarum]
MSRPQKSGDEKRTVTVRVRFTPAEKKQLWETAAEAGRSPSDFIRAASLGCKPLRPKPTPEREALIRLQAELGKVGSNVNQIAHALNTCLLNGDPVSVPEEAISRAMSNVEILTHAIQLELRHGH